MNDCRLITITPEIEKLIGFCARVSNPANQDNPDVSKLLKYCIDNKHWSIFEMGNMVLEVTTTLDISHQIVRHKSYSFQQTSRRYSSEGIEFWFGEPRMQDPKNRQNSTDTCSDELKDWWKKVTYLLSVRTIEVYDEAIRRGMARECARKILPQGTVTRLYMQGSIRSWIHYIDLRTGNGTQKEHMDVAESAKSIFVKEMPIIAKALNWI